MRARNLKPGFFKNEHLAECSAFARLLFAGLWCVADREGRLEDRPKRLKAELLPYDDCNVDALLNELAERDFIIRYEVCGNRTIQVVNFVVHQNPHYKESPSVIPAMDGWEDSAYVGGGVPEAKRQEIFERAGRRCVSCGSSDNLTLDHIIPRSKGGTNDDDNLQTLCRRCNCTKHNRQASADRRSSIDQSSADLPGNSPGGFPLTDSLLLIPDPGLGTTRARARDPATIRPVPKPKRGDAPPSPPLHSSESHTDAWFEHVCLGVYRKPPTEVTASERSKAQAPAQELREMGVDPPEIVRRCDGWRAHWTHLTISAPALVSNWSALGELLAKERTSDDQPTPAERREQERAERDSSVCAGRSRTPRRAGRRCNYCQAECRLTAASARTVATTGASWTTAGHAWGRGWSAPSAAAHAS